MWYPFKGLVGYFRRSNAAFRFRDQAATAATSAERAHLLRQAVQLLPDSRYLLFDLAVALARNGEFTEAAERWREVIRLHHHRLLTGEELAWLLPVLPLVATEVLAELSHPKGRYFPSPRFHMWWRNVTETEQHWGVEAGQAWRMDLMQNLLPYIVTVLAHNASGPGRVVFQCWNDVNEDSDELGETTWEWNAAREVRCVAERVKGH